MPVDLSGRFSQKALAELIGVTQPAVSGYVKQGLIDPKDTLGAALQNYCTRIREQAAGRGGADAQVRLALAKADEAEVKTANLRIEYHRKLEELVLVSDVVGIVSDWAHHTNREIRGMVAKLRSEIESAHKIKLDDETLNEIVESAIERIGGFARQCRDDCGDSGDDI